VKITDAALTEAAGCRRYISDRFLPDKASTDRRRPANCASRPPCCAGAARDGAAARRAHPRRRGRRAGAGLREAAQLKEQTDKIQETFVEAKNAWLSDKGIADATVDADEIATSELLERRPVQRMLQEEADKCLS